MKILLISSNVSATPYAVYPLGLGMVYTALSEAGHEVEIFDFLQNKRSLDTVEDKVKEFQPELIGISIRNIDNVNMLNEQRYISVAKNIVARIKEHFSIPVVLGGSGFSIMPKQILNATNADYGLVGEGEAAFVGFVNKLSQNKKPSQKIVKSSSSLRDSEIPSAYYDPKLMKFYLQSGNVASVQTKRGCNQGCIYCTYPFLEGKKIRPRDPKRVVDDVELLQKKHKAKYIFFTDSVFNDNQGRYIEVVEEMKKRRIHIPWCAFFKPKGLNSEVIELMKQTGLISAEVGADAANDKALKALGKDFLFSDVIETNELFYRNGVASANYFMLAGPGETKQSIFKDIENIRSLENTVSFIFMGIRILPGTKLYDLALKNNIIDFQNNLLDPVYYIEPGINRKWLEDTLTEAFAGLRHCVFPPDALDSSLQFLHKLGYSGPMWEMLIPGKSKRNRKRNVRKRT